MILKERHRASTENRQLQQTIANLRSQLEVERKMFDQQVTEIRNYTDRPIVIRPHPRNNVSIDVRKYQNVRMVGPQRDRSTYDDTDLADRLKSAWAVVNHSSNPAMTAAIAGIPVYVSEASLSYDVGNKNYQNMILIFYKIKN